MPKMDGVYSRQPLQNGCCLLTQERYWEIEEVDQERVIDMASEAWASMAMLWRHMYVNPYAAGG